MRRKISLYIAGMPVDLDEQSFILFNHTIEEMGNPTIVKNSFSQQITLKGTAQNNKIFGYIYRSDRETNISNDYAGIHFDPTRKTPFVIYNEMSEVLEEGYVKLDKVARNGKLIEYSITLYGGLGSFFYGLMYKADGSKKTLADMDYFDTDGARVNLFPISPAASSVNDAWTYLSGGTPNYKTWNIVNFAPAYNGLPSGFDANKALYVNRNIYINLPLEATVDGVTYGKLTGASTFLMNFTNSHTEWEIKDLRWYLQRPVISVKSIIEAIVDSVNNGGYEVKLDSTFFNSSNPYYNDAWMSLQMIAEADRSSSDCINHILQSSKSPAEILISYAKVFGLVFLYDSAEKKVSIMQRSAFYQSASVIDLTKRLQVTDIRINPLVADSLIYQFGEQTIGQFAKEYAEEYNRAYGIQRVNTGFEFNSNINVLTKDLAFQDAVEVMEFNRLFTSSSLTRSGTDPHAEMMTLPSFEAVNVQMWATVNEEETSTEVPVEAPPRGNTHYDNVDYPNGDWLPKVQLHEADNKGIDGSDVLMFFSGMKQTPLYVEGYEGTRKIYYLTDDHADMTLLNEGVPCWNLTGEGTALTSLPSFTRNRIGADNETIEASWEWGEPLARAVPGVQGDVSIYKEWWKDYLTDLYDNDTRIMSCKVNLKGFMVNQSLMRRIFFFEGAMWRLNKIINHSLTTWDDTECEFVKIQDINNYIG